MRPRPVHKGGGGVKRGFKGGVERGEGGGGGGGGLEMMFEGEGGETLEALPEFLAVTAQVNLQVGLVCFLPVWSSRLWCHQTVLSVVFRWRRKSVATKRHGYIQTWWDVL